MSASSITGAAFILVSSSNTHWNTDAHFYPHVILMSWYALTILSEFFSFCIVGHGIWVINPFKYSHWSWYPSQDTNLMLPVSALPPIQCSPAISTSWAHSFTNREIFTWAYCRELDVIVYTFRSGTFKKTTPFAHAAIYSHAPQKLFCCRTPLHCALWQ